MEPAVFILAIMGCGEGNAACAPLSVMPTHYHSAAACAAGGKQALLRPIDTDFPVVIAQCLKMDPAAAALLEASDLEQREPERKVRPAQTPGPWGPQRARG